MVVLISELAVRGVERARGAPNGPAETVRGVGSTVRGRVDGYVASGRRYVASGRR